MQQPRGARLAAMRKSRPTSRTARMLMAMGVFAGSRTADLLITGMPGERRSRRKGRRYLPIRSSG
jgi:hypothetical protein